MSATVTPDITLSADLAADLVARTRAVASDMRAAASARVWRVADEIVEGVLEREWTAFEIDAAVDAAAAASGLDAALVRDVLLRCALRDPRLLQVPPALGAAAQLRLVRGFLGIEEVSLWAPGSSGIECVQYVGPRHATRRMRSVARQVLGGRRVAEPHEHIHGVRVLRWERPYAALVVKTKPSRTRAVLPLLDEVAATLGTVLERDLLLDRSDARQRIVAAASERRLARLGFDLHDGPIQDLLVIAADLRDLRRRLKERLVATGALEEWDAHLLARLNEVEDDIREVDRDLRGLAHSLEPPSLQNRRFEELAERELATFADRTEIELTWEPVGDFAVLTPSQRIALLLALRETLANVREHSGASRVDVRLTAERDSISLEIVDDGRGFEVEQVLTRAAHNGRLGLLGMSERISLLGGRFAVESRVGGPTRTALTVPMMRAVSATEADRWSTHVERRTADGRRRTD
jgi:signal transduction histidine kinase